MTQTSPIHVLAFDAALPCPGLDRLLLQARDEATARAIQLTFGFARTRPLTGGTVEVHLPRSERPCPVAVGSGWRLPSLYRVLRAHTQ